MKRLWKYVGIAALVAVLGLGGAAAAAFAQDPVGEADGPFNYVQRFRQTLAGILGISVEEYDNAVVQAQDQVLNDAVTEGWLTQDQADRMRERLSRVPGDMAGGMGRGLDRFGWGVPGGRGTNLLAVAADQLGMSQSELRTAVQEGQTIAALAQEKGVDPQAIADACLAAVDENLQQAVAEGRLTQKMADALLEQAQPRVTEQLNSAWEDLPGGLRGGRHGGRMLRDCPGGDSEDDA